MNTITFHCSGISPMFLGGADANTPELRPSSIKGALRFWWRALQPQMDPKALNQKESAIFGGTGAGGSGVARRSKVILRTRLTHSQIGDRPDPEEYPGIYYLLYSTYMNDRSPFTEIEFQVTLQAYDVHIEALKDAAYAFWCLANFGGLGTRSRRTAGNFSIERVEVSQETPMAIPLTSSAKSIQEQATYLQQNLANLCKHFGTTSTPQQTEYPSLRSCKIYMGTVLTYDSWGTMNEIGKAFRDFRSLRPPDYDRVKKYLKTEQLNQSIERAAFGLPLQFRFSSLKKVNANINPAEKRVDRSASSLLMRIGKLEEQYYPILINFNSRLIPSRTNLRVSSSGPNKKAPPVYVPPPQPTIKQNFINAYLTPNQRQQIL